MITFSKHRIILLVKVIALTLAVRLAVLVTQRALGIGWDFHPDATYYVARIVDVRLFGLPQTLAAGDFENALFVVLGYVVSVLIHRVFDDSTVLISTNLLISILTVSKLLEICVVRDERRLPIPVIFFIFSPYLAHIAVHPLKDTLFIYLAMCLLSAFIRNSFFAILVHATLLVATRYYLGVVTSGILLSWWLANRYTLSKRNLILALILLIGAMHYLAYDQLSARLIVEFEGRNFYPNGFVLVPDSVTIRLMFGWFFNFLVPFPFVPTSAAEVGYFFHWLLLTYLIVIVARRQYKNGLPQDQFGLLLSVAFLFSFVLTTTPGTGPLVRYRLASELMLLIAICPSPRKIYRRDRKSRLVG